MQVELESRRISVKTEAEIRVNYKGVEVGFYRADLWVAERVIIELKVARSYVAEDEPQLGVALESGDWLVRVG